MSQALAAGRGGGTRQPDLLTGGRACYRLYRTADGRHVALAALEPKFWAEVLRGDGATRLDRLPGRGRCRRTALIAEVQLRSSGPSPGALDRACVRRCRLLLRRPVWHDRRRWWPTRRSPRAASCPRGRKGQDRPADAGRRRLGRAAARRCGRSAPEEAARGVGPPPPIRPAGRRRGGARPVPRPRVLDRLAGRRLSRLSDPVTPPLPVEEPTPMTDRTPACGTSSGSRSGAPADCRPPHAPGDRALGAKKMQAGEGRSPFGAVVAKDGRIVGEGWNRVTSSGRPPRPMRRWWRSGPRRRARRNHPISRRGPLHQFASPVPECASPRRCGPGSTPSVYRHTTAPTPRRSTSTTAYFYEQVCKPVDARARADDPPPAGGGQGRLRRMGGEAGQGDVACRRCRRLVPDPCRPSRRRISASGSPAASAFHPGEAQVARPGYRP